jgi:hypothetical protein
MNVMLDLETFGTTPGCAIRSIGAVTFALEGDHAEQSFSVNIDTHSCLYARLHIEQGTHEWWKQQSAEARAALQIDARPLSAVVAEFETWCKRQSSMNDLKIWAQGSNFDPVLWKAAAKAVGRGVSWKFYNCRDTRTLYELAGFDPRSVARVGVYHSALDDARHQVRCCREAYKKLKNSMRVSDLET